MCVSYFILPDFSKIYRYRVFLRRDGRKEIIEADSIHDAMYSIPIACYNLRILIAIYSAVSIEMKTNSKAKFKITTTQSIQKNYQ